MKKYKWMGILGAWVLAVGLLVSGCSASRSPEAMVQTASKCLQEAKSMEGTQITVNTQESHRYTYAFQWQRDPYLLYFQNYARDEKVPYVTCYYEQHDGQLVNYFKSIYNDPEKKQEIWMQEWLTDIQEQAVRVEYDPAVLGGILLGGLEQAKVVGSSKINNSSATQIDGVLQGQALQDALCNQYFFSSATRRADRDEEDAALYEEMGVVPLSIWIDGQGRLVRARLDVTEAVVRVLGYAEKAEDGTANQCYLELNLGNYDRVPAITVPEEAYQGEKV